jgi:hypothetical protein
MGRKPEEAILATVVGMGSGGMGGLRERLPPLTGRTIIR